MLGLTGKIASCIPALARGPVAQFGIGLRTCDGIEVCAGDVVTPLSAQSVSKLFTLTLAIQHMKDDLWERTERKPSGSPFNSLVRLENEQGKPRNLFINAGAIAVADRLVSCGKLQRGGAKAHVLALVGSLCGEHVVFNEEVAQSEAETGLHNIALADFMKSFSKIGVGGAIVADVPDQFTLCAWSPALGATGNSLLGMKALGWVVGMLGLSIF